MRRRVRNVEDMPLRLRSRNSTRLNWEPTETIRRAPFSAAISSATSWLVPGRRDELELHAQLLQAAAAGRAAVGVGVHDELRAAAQSGLSGRVHVAHDHVRGEALLEQGLGAAVDRDDHGTHVADERPQGAQVALVADAADDHERGAIAKVGGEAGQLDPAGQQLALLAHVLDRVVGEALERLADLAAAWPRFRRRRARGRAPRRARAARRRAAPRRRPARRLALASRLRPARAPGRRRRAPRTASRREDRRAGRPLRPAAAARGWGRTRRRTDCS